MATDRYHRHVRHARLSVPHGAPTRRLAFAMEESLRLATLPGENEGRSYYFRRLRIRGVPSDGDRRFWLEAFERALFEAASLAVHATDARSLSAPAVYFQGETEALELLLYRLVSGQPASEWFWPAVLERELEADGQAEAGSATPSLVTQIIERLRAHEASWAAVAIVLFAAAEPVDAVRLLMAIPPPIASRWLEEMPVSQASRPAHRDPSRMPRLGTPAPHRAIAQAVEAFGAEEVRTLWLATMAVIFEAPAALASGIAVERARRLIEAHVESSRAGREARAFKNTCHGESETTAVTESPAASGNTQEAAPSEPASISRERERAFPASEETIPREREQAHPPSGLSVNNPEASLPVLYRVEGAPTNGAGLFFLVNVLDRLGIAESPPGLGIQILHRLAAQTGMPADDPIALWLATIEESALTTEVRAWSLALHRYIRLIAVHAGEDPLTAREIVNRPGLFSVNRTDLDITLPFDNADIRIRRAGLDIDPGWVRWFGRVIRFHYE